MRHIKKFNESHESINIEKAKAEEVFHDLISFLEKEYPIAKFEIKKSYGGNSIKPCWTLEVPITKYFLKYGSKFEYSKEFLNELDRLIEKAKAEDLICDFNLPNGYLTRLDRGTSADYQRFIININLLK